MDLEIRTVNKDGLRGTKAIRDMKKDQIAVHLPSQLTVPLGEGKVTPEVCQAISSIILVYVAEFRLAQAIAYSNIA